MIEQPRKPIGQDRAGEWTNKAHTDTGLQLPASPYAASTPLEVDTLLSGFYTDAAKVNQEIDRRVSSAHYRLGHRKGYGRGLRNGGWPMDAASTLTALEEAINEGKIVAYEVKLSREILTDVEDLKAQRAEIVAQTTELDDEFRRRPWSRFFLVTSSTGGHVHSSMHCHTCRWDTEFGWLPSLSGKDEPTAVADQGAILCTACYPSAPVEWTRGKEPAADTCPGSNKPSSSEPHRYGRTVYGTCPVCGEGFPSGYSGIRKHKTPKPKAAKK